MPYIYPAPTLKTIFYDVLYISALMYALHVQMLLNFYKHIHYAILYSECATGCVMWLESSDVYIVST